MMPSSNEAVDVTHVDTKRIELFSDDLDKCLLKLELYLNQSLSHEHLSGFVELKRQELVKSINKLRDTHTPARLLQEILSTLTLPSSQKSGDTNNNDNISLNGTSHEEKTTSLPHVRCLCSDINQFVVVPKSYHILSARCHNFTPELLQRISQSEDQDGKIGFVLEKELKIKNYCGWLYVDEEHKFFGIISDCLFVLYETENSDRSILSFSLNQCLAELTQSTDENALTINTADDVLYFYTDSQEQTTQWITWINMGAQLSLAELITYYKKPSEMTPSVTAEDVSIQCDEASIPSVLVRQSSTCLSKRLSVSTQSSISEEPEADVTESQSNTLTSEEEKLSSNSSRTELCDDSMIVQLRSKNIEGRRPRSSIEVRRICSGVGVNRSVSSRNSYDFGQDQGTNRVYLTAQQLKRSIKMRKVKSFSENIGLRISYTDIQPSKRHENPAYLDQPDFNRPADQLDNISLIDQTDSQLLADEKLEMKVPVTSQSSSSSANSERSLSIPPRKPTRSHISVSQSNLNTLPINQSKFDTLSINQSQHGSYISQSTGNLSMLKDSKTIPSTSSQYNTLNSDRKRRKTTTVLANSKSQGLSTADMADLCEMQGYLYIRKMIKWQTYYCVVYNGVFSLFKDITSASPEFQYRLKTCVISPLEEKKFKKPFAFKITNVKRSSKSSYLAALSDTDLYSWYSVFNNYVKDALDLPMLEKMSADGDSYSSRHEETTLNGSVADGSSFYLASSIEEWRNTSSFGSAADMSQSTESLDETSPRKYSTKQTANRRHTVNTADMSRVSYGDDSGSSSETDCNDNLRLHSTESKSEQQRKQLLERMKREKERIQRNIELQDRRNQEEIEAEKIKNYTRLQQRRVSAQLKIDYFEKQLHSERDQGQEKKTSNFLRKNHHKHDKNTKQTPASSENSELIRKQMEELRAKLDSIDKGLTGTSKRDDSKKRPLIHHAQKPLTLYDSSHSLLTHQKLIGLNSIIEALDSSSCQSRNCQKSPHRPNSIAGCHDLSPTNQMLDVVDEPTVITNHNTVLSDEQDQEAIPQISARTLEVINEFETMTRELLSRKPSISYSG